MNIIKTLNKHNFLILGVLWVAVGLTVWDFLGKLNPITIVVVVIGIYLLSIQLSNTPTLNTKTYTKEANKKIKEAKLEQTKSINTEKEKVFLTLGKKDTVLTPDELYQMNTIDDNPYIKTFIALHPNTPVTVLEELSFSKNKNVLQALNSNPRTPNSIKSKLGLTQITETISDEETQIKLLSNPTTTSAILEHVYENPYNYFEVAVKLITHPNTPINIFEAITNSDEDEILVALASSPHLISKPLMVNKLKQWNSYDIMLAFLTNPIVDNKLIELYDPVNHDNISLNEIVRDPDVELSLPVLAYVARKSVVLRKMLADKIRLLSPAHKNMPTEDLIRNF